MPGNFASGTAGITASSELNRLAAGLQGTYGWSVQSGAVTFSSGLIFNVAAIAAGDYTVNSVSGSVYAGGTTTLATQDPTNPRVDIIVITSAGAVSNVTGTPAALTTTSGPVPPTPSASQLEIARIYVPISGTALSASSITDRRTSLGGYVPNRQTFAASGTWTKPTGTWTLVRLWGGGGGGGGGKGIAAGTAHPGGGGGGGGACTEQWFLASTLGATETITIGAGGTAGTGGSAVDGVNGGVGGNTSFGTWAYAYGGGGAHGGENGGGFGGSGGGSMSAGATPAATSWVVGGGPRGQYNSNLNLVGGLGFSGANSGDSNAVPGGMADFGGASGGNTSSNGAATSGAGGSSRMGGGAGGAGGAASSAEVEQAGGAGGKSNSGSAGGGGAGGAVDGGAGTAGTTGVGTNYGGSGGGGGGGQGLGTGGAGAVGGAKGGGGGGGGGGTSVGGAGGVGGVGWMEVITF